MRRKISGTDAVLSRAVRALDHGKVDLAEHNFTATLRSQPKNVLALAGLGLVNARKNKRKEALKYFARALDFAPHSRDLVQEILQAPRPSGSNQLRDLEHLAEIRPNSTALLLALIKLQLQARRKAKADRWYERLVKIQPKVAEGWINRGLGRNMRNDGKGARREFDRAAKLDPANVEIYQLRGDLYLEAKDYGSALADFQRVARLARRSSLGFRRCGDAYRAKGDRSHAKNDYARAIKMYSQALQRNPQDTDAHLGIAGACESLRDYGRAFKHYRRVVQLAPKSAFAHGLLGQAYEGAYRGKPEFAKAQGEYRQAIKLDPKDRRGSYALGDLYLNWKKYKEAQTVFKYLLDTDPKDARPHYGLGMAHQGQGQFGEAAKHYRRFIKLEPSDRRGLYALGDLYLAWGKHTDAEKVFRGILKTDPNDARSHYGLGLAYEGRKQLPKALEQYQRGVQLDSGNLDALVKCGNIHLALGDRDAALADYDRVVKLAPRLADGYGLRGSVYQEQKKFGEAEREYRRAIQLAPTDTRGHYALGNLYLDWSKYKDAEKLFKQVVKANPNDPRAHYSLGLAHYYLDQYESAREDLDIALKRNPTDVTALRLRGLIFESFGSDGKHDYYESYKSALKDYEELVRLAPREADAHTRHASALVALSSYDRAVAAYNRALELDGKNAQTWADKADCLRLWADLFEVGALVGEKLTEGRAAADAALKLDPQHAMAHAVRGAILTHLTGYDEALRSLNAALGSDPNYQWARKERAKALYFRGDAQRALDVFTELAGASTGFESLGLAGQFLTRRKLGRPEEANKTLENSLGNPPRDPNACIGLGRSFVEFKAFPEAAANFLQAIRLDPGLPAAHNEFAWCHTELETNDELLARCIDHAELAVALSPDRAIKGNYLDTLGWLWYLRRDFKKARRYLRQAIKLTEPDVLIRHHLAVVEQQLGTEKA
jgi:tetratricopeptide (TPR) repeat protein